MLTIKFEADGGCHFNAIGGVKEIFIWELQ
jgi:hypothetical protein